MSGVQPDEIETLELEAELLRRDFRAFVRAAWHEIDPAPLLWGWHMDVICLALEAVAKGQLQRLIINIPPGHAKSMLVSVLWPAWRWTRSPTWQVLTASHNAGLSTRDAVKARTLMATNWYIERFRRDWGFAEDQNLKTRYLNTKGGTRQALSVGSGNTGWRGDCLLVDDPLDATDAHSQVERERVIVWKTQTMTSRFNDLAKAEQVIIMQRLHEQDLTGYLLANERSDWEHLCLPSKFEPARRSVVKGHDGRVIVRDPRKSEGELLFPTLFSTDVLAQQERSMGSYAFAGQHQQRPVPASGGLLRREWFRKRWAHEPKGPDTTKPPAQFDDMRIFVDASFKGTKDSDRVAIGVFGKKGTDVYLMDLEWRTMGFVDTINALTALKAKWPKVSGIYIEDKANGSAIIDTLKSKLPGIVPIQPEGGKEARVAAASPYIEAGNCVLPESAPWVADAIAEACSFPKGLHDDFVDVLAYAMVNLCSRNNMAGWLAYAR